MEGPPDIGLPSKTFFLDADSNYANPAEPLLGSTARIRFKWISYYGLTGLSRIMRVIGERERERELSLIHI